MGDGDFSAPVERYEWEDEIGSELDDSSESERIRHLESLIYPGEHLYDGHAFSKKEIQTFRALTGLKNIDPSFLIENLDRFVLRVGWKTARLIKKRASDRIFDLESELLNPLRRAMAAFSTRDIQLEFFQDEMALDLDDLADLKLAIEKFLEKSDTQIDLIKSTSRPGKSFDSDLKYYHVHLTDTLLEYLGCTELPSRLSDDVNSWFYQVVQLLAGPVFGRSRGRDGFTSLVREFVDNLNANIKRAQENGTP